ncbi:peptidylprolyl isomerase [Candidatus Woesearchaeota archaeon]|nr:peptidylprolyl isomerase [Candidatus Woesearchaeota archaeon]
MTKTKERDFIEIDYVGRIKDTNQIFDLTDVELAKKEKIYNENAKYGPRIICLGENQVLQAIDKFLVDKTVGENYILELKPEEGFGKKNANLIKIMPSDILVKQKINPFPGLQIHAGGLIGTIRSVTGGRVTIDFNHPLAGKNLTYNVKINRIVERNDEKIKSLIENMLNVSDKEYDLKMEGDKIRISLKVTIPTEAKKEVIEKAKKLILDVSVIFN